MKEVLEVLTELDTSLTNLSSVCLINKRALTRVDGKA